MADISKVRMLNGTEYNYKDAKARSDIEGLKADLDAQTGIISLLKDFYIKTSTTPISLTPIASTAGRMCAVVDCVAGDKFVINAYSNSAQARAWCFIDSTNTALLMADELVTITDTEITAPANASKLIINDMNGGMSYKVGNNLASKMGSGLSDDAKASLMEMFKNIDYSSDYGQTLYNNLYYAIYGHMPSSAEPEFEYKSERDGLLSVQEYVDGYIVSGSPSESLVQGTLTVYARKATTSGVSAYITYPFGVYDDTYGSFQVTAKVHSEYFYGDPNVGGSIRIEIGNSSHGAQFYISEESNGNIIVRYDTGAERHFISTPFSADDYHTFVVTANGDKQSLMIDGLDIVSNVDMSTQFVDTIRLMILSTSTLQDVTASIKDVSLFNARDDGDNSINYNPVVKIKNIREAYPGANDDELLARAILLSRMIGKEASILWDGEDIHFTGIVNHECYGFSGIDFNGVNIYMPNYTGTSIISIRPDSTYDKYFNSDDFTQYNTSNSELFGKIFTMNKIREGIASMSLGKRYGNDSQDAMYSCPIIKTSTDGVYETGELFVYPQNGDVLCRNIHEYPSNRFFIKNAIINAYEGNNFTCFIECYRSNTLITDFVLKGISRYNGSYKVGVFNLHNCCDVEFCHISGVNPIRRDTGMYAFAFMSMAFSNVHHVFLGDSNSWGCMGGRFHTYCKFESCFFGRWDSHFAQFGNNIINNCVINHMTFGLGNGSLTIKNSTFILENTNAHIDDAYVLINFRSDCPGGYSGNVIIDNCQFKSALSNSEKYTALFDGSAQFKKPSDSAITPKEDVVRIIKNCSFDDKCKHVIVTGSEYADDAVFFEGYHYTISDSVLNSESVIKSLTAQNAKNVRVKSCDLSGQLLENITCDVQVSDCKLNAITCDTTLPNVTMTGCILTGTQDTNNFTKYAFSGNIASDMASVNKHS